MRSYIRPWTKYVGIPDPYPPAENYVVTSWMLTLYTPSAFLRELTNYVAPPYPQILDMMCIIIILSKYVLLIVYAVTPHWFLSLPICLVVVEWPPRIFVLFVLFAPDPNFRRTESFVLWRRFSSSALSKYTLDERDYVRAVHKLEIYSNTEPNAWNNRYRRLGSFEFSWQTYINLGPLWRHNTEK